MLNAIRIYFSPKLIKKDARVPHHYPVFCFEIWFWAVSMGGIIIEVIGNSPNIIDAETEQIRAF